MSIKSKAVGITLGSAAGLLLSKGVMEKAATRVAENPEVASFTLWEANTSRYLVGWAFTQHPEISVGLTMLAGSMMITPFVTKFMDGGA